MKEINLSQLSEKEKGYLFGLFEGDGYKIYGKAGRHYVVEFYLNSERDKEIIKQIIFILQKIGLNPSEYQDKRFNCKKIKSYSKEFFNIISKNTNLLNKSREFNIGFVSGIIDAEGYVNPKKYCIEVVNTNKQMLEQCQNFLNSINIHASLNKRKRSIKDTKDSYRMYISVNFKKLQHLSIKVKKLNK